jgi:hypothetical protein
VNSGFHACKAGTLLLEPHFQSILLWLFEDGGLVCYLPRLASNHDLLNVSFSSSYDYKCEPLASDPLLYFFGCKIFLRKESRFLYSYLMIQTQ